MKSYTKYSLILSSVLLASCANQNTKITTNIMPTTNPCSKLELLKSAYHDDFNQLKEIKIKARASNSWKAKYQLFGKNCQVFSWGEAQSTYSCNLIAPNEQAARKYYQNAKETTQQCLGEQWQLVESNRIHDEGMKTTFTHSDVKANEKLTFSTHLVPTSGLFSTTWTIYYYVGNISSIK
ncbi:hypothetical protein [Colwellia ponticola]|uniref:Orphan protein n=1 Tax=Colwellia ponticola TaxID=2304625 RepID=A0A8H2PMV7_9GAMM|nr:hypothetical protein [Colwellia ponticola]TMM46848.1 hypothetical protein FCS21_03460 [Colwellia ponticola]